MPANLRFLSYGFAEKFPLQTPKIALIHESYAFTSAKA